MEIAKDYGEKWFLGHAVRHLGVVLLTLKLFIFPTSPFYEAIFRKCPISFSIQRPATAHRFTFSSKPECLRRLEPVNESR